MKKPVEKIRCSDRAIVTEADESVNSALTPNFFPGCFSKNSLVLFQKQYLAASQSCLLVKDV
ncbi:MAG: hypothetical protein WCG81_10370 [Candidatus Angelobacter sp.]